jgi:hypothetical protein
VVAIFPRLFELVAEITPFKHFGDIGSAGFNGFLDPFGNQYERVVQGGHSGALVIENHGNIARFIVRQTDEPRSDVLVSDAVSIVSQVCWLVWVILAAVVLLVGTFTVGWVSEITQISWAIWALAYAFLVWLTLQTV